MLYLFSRCFAAFPDFFFENIVIRLLIFSFGRERLSWSVLTVFQFLFDFRDLFLCYKKNPTVLCVEYFLLHFVCLFGGAGARNLCGRTFIRGFSVGTAISLTLTSILNRVSGIHFLTLFIPTFHLFILLCN